MLKRTRIIGFEFSTTQTYVVELGDLVLRPIKDQGQILETGTAITAITKASPGVVTSASHGLSNGDRVYISGVIGMTEVNSRVYIVANKDTNTFELTDLYGSNVNSTNWTTYSSGGTVARLYQLTTTYAHGDVFALNYAQTADTMYIVHTGYVVRKVTRTGHASWTITNVTFGPTQATPTNLNVTASPASGATVNYYKVTAVNDDNNSEESLPTAADDATNDLTVAGNLNTVTWTAASGAERYNVYKAENGIYGYIGGTTGTSFVDDNISPDLADTPPSARDPFSGSSNYPGAVDFHEGRLWFGGTLNTPGGVWGSQSGIYENLNVSVPVKANDAISFELRPGVNAVKSFASIKELCVFTANAEHTVKGGASTDFITPASIVTKRHSRRGSAAIDSLVIGDVALFVQRRGAVIRAFGYSFEKDGFVTNDLTLLAPHFFQGHTIVDWCYQEHPHAVVWIVRDDGVLLSMTFVAEQNVIAFSEHYLGGTFSTYDYGFVESCTCIQGTVEDEVYLVVKRTVNSTTKRYIEMLNVRWNGDSDDMEDAKFFDAAITYDGALTSTVTGLHHLEGEEVYALADGSIQGPFTVSSGAITLTTAASVVQVGLAFTPEVKDLPVVRETQEGARQGRRVAVNKVGLKLRHSRGVKIMHPDDEDRFIELDDRNSEAWDAATEVTDGDIEPRTPDGRWDMNGAILLKGTPGLPMEIVSITKDVTVGG